MLRFFYKHIFPQLCGGKNILICCHGFVIKAIIAHLEGIGAEEWRENMRNEKHKDKPCKLRTPNAIPIIYHIDHTGADALSPKLAWAAYKAQHGDGAAAKPPAGAAAAASAAALAPLPPPPPPPLPGPSVHPPASVPAAGAALPAPAGFFAAPRFTRCQDLDAALALLREIAPADGAAAAGAAAATDAAAASSGDRAAAVFAAAERASRRGSEPADGDAADDAPEPDLSNLLRARSSRKGAGGAAPAPPALPAPAATRGSKL